MSDQITVIGFLNIFINAQCPGQLNAQYSHMAALWFKEQLQTWAEYTVLQDLTNQHKFTYSFPGQDGYSRRFACAAFTAYLGKGAFHHSTGTQNLRLGACCLYVLQILLPDLQDKQTKYRHKLILMTRQPTTAKAKMQLRYLIPHFQDFLWVGVQWDELIGYSSLAESIFLCPL